MLYTDVKRWVCHANPGNKKSEITPKIHPEKVQTNQSHSGWNTDCFTTLTDSSGELPVLLLVLHQHSHQVKQVQRRSTAAWELHVPICGFWLFLRGIVGSAYEMDVLSLFASPAAPSTGFPPLPVLLEQGERCTDADPMAAGGSTSPQVQCQACDGETEI